MSDFTTQQITIAGQSLRIATRKGNSSVMPLLIFNGIGASLELVLPFADHLDPDQPVIAFDVPGVGGSPTPMWPYRFSCLATLITKMLDHLGHAQVDVIGLSWGGLFCQEFARISPDRCRRIILAATCCGVTSIPPSLKILSIMASPRRYSDPDYFCSIAHELYGGKFRTDKDLSIKYAKKMSSDKNGEPQNVLGYTYQMMAVWGWSSLLWMHKIKQPTLILAGNDDPLIHLANMELLYNRIPNSEMHIVDDGHLFLITSTDEVAPIINEFLF